MGQPLDPHGVADLKAGASMVSDRSNVTSSFVATNHWKLLGERRSFALPDRNVRVADARVCNADKNFPRLEVLRLDDRPVLTHLELCMISFVDDGGLHHGNGFAAMGSHAVIRYQFTGELTNGLHRMHESYLQASENVQVDGLKTELYVCIHVDSCYFRAKKVMRGTHVSLINVVHIHIYSIDSCVWIKATFERQFAL